MQDPGHKMQDARRRRWNGAHHAKADRAGGTTLNPRLVFSQNKEKAMQFPNLPGFQHMNHILHLKSVFSLLYGMR